MMSDDPKLAWYTALWTHIRDQAKAATRADLFDTAEALHVNRARKTP
jgi:hypothetical protein